jgi:C4-dicarboxylate-binding protein DctP
MKLLAHLLAVLLTAATVGPALAAEDGLVIRFSHVVAADSPKGKAAEKFAQLAAERTAGKVRVEVFPNSRLYGDKDEMAALLAGQVEMLAPSLSKLKMLHTTDFEVFDLPYLFPDMAAVHRVTQGPIGKSLLAELDRQGVVGLAFWDNGFKQMSANRPLRVPADFAGLTLRIQPSAVLDAQMKALGARPRPLDFSEVYGALKVGAVDGTEGPVSNFYTQNLHLAQKYLTLSNHGYLGYAVIANKKFWGGLSPDIRSALESALRDATSYANAGAEENNAAALAAVRKSGRTQIIELTAAEKSAWRKALGKVHEQVAPKIPKELVHGIYKETGYVPLADN